MSISKEIGWSAKENLLYDIYKKLKRANGLGYQLAQGDFHQGSSSIPIIYTIGTMTIGSTFKIG